MHPPFLKNSQKYFSRVHPPLGLCRRHRHPVPWGDGGPLWEPSQGLRVPSQPFNGGQPGKAGATGTSCPGVTEGLFGSHPRVFGTPPSHLTVASRAKRAQLAPRALGCRWASSVAIPPEPNTHPETLQNIQWWWWRRSALSTEVLKK